MTVPLSPPPIARWRRSRLAAAAEAIASPFVLVLNRPSTAPIARLLHEFALRCNGIGNNAETAHGLTRGEERFLRRSLRHWAQGVVLDVGANRGGWSRFVRHLAPQARIVACEPHPVTFAALAKAAEPLRIEALNLALAAQEGSLTLYDFPDADGSTQASLDPGVVRFYGGQEPLAHVVRSTTLDMLTRDLAIERIALLKIDTEGFDLDVLRGAARLLAERRIGMIQFEFIEANIVRRVAMADFFALLAPAGYRLHRIAVGGSLVPLGPYSPKAHEIYSRHNLVAVPD